MARHVEEQGLSIPPSPRPDVIAMVYSERHRMLIVGTINGEVSQLFAPPFLS